MIKKYGDIISGTAIFLFATLYFSQISTIKIIDSASVDAAFIPKIISVFLFVLSIGVILSGVKHAKKFDLTTTNQKLEEDSKVLWIPTIQTAVLLLIYVALFVKIGFLTTTIFYLFIQFLVLSPTKNLKKIVFYAAMSIIAALIFQYIFISLLYVMLPEGLLR